MIVSAVKAVSINTDFPGTRGGIRKPDKNKLLSGHCLNNF